MMLTGHLALQACLACFFLAFLPPSEATFAPEATTENSFISSSTSVSVSVRKVYRIRGKVLELEKKKNRSLLNFIRRRNRRLGIREKNENKARKYTRQRKTSPTKNLLSKPTIFRNKYTMNKTPNADKNNRILSASLKATPTHLSSAYKAHLNENINSIKLHQLNSSAEANYVALRRNIKVKKPKVVTENLVTKPDNITHLVDNMIQQLKDDLANILKITQNTPHHDRTIVKRAAKTKVEDFFEGLSSAIDTQSKPSRNCITGKEDRLKAASNILAATRDISDALASTVDIGDITDIKRANISMVVSKKHLVSNTSTDWQEGKVEVSLPDQPNIAKNDSTVTVSFTSYNNLGSLMNGKDDIRSPVLSVNVIRNRNSNQKRSISLTKPIKFLLHHKPFRKIRKRKCTYWDFKYAKWAGDGCYTIRKHSTATATACKCYHLTDFALIVEETEEEEPISTTTTTTTTTTSTTTTTTIATTTTATTINYSGSGLKFGDRIIPIFSLEETTPAFKVYQVTKLPGIKEQKVKKQSKWLLEKEKPVGVLNPRTQVDLDYEYYWQELEREEQNLVEDELLEQEYEALRILI